MKNNYRLLLVVLLSVYFTVAYSQEKKDLPPFRYMHMASPKEALLKIDRNFSSSSAPFGNVRAIAEFEPMSAVIIAYPFGIPMDFIKLLAEKDTVITIVYNEEEETELALEYETANIDMSRIKFMTATTDSYWTRDYSPFFIRDGENQLSVVDFNYNRPRPNDNAFPSKLATYLEIPYYAMNVVHTGGNYMTDGYGVSASTTIVYSESMENGISNAEVDKRMNDYLGIEKHMVLKDPNNTYIDHIDCWGKFLDVDKVLIREVPPSHAQFNEIEAMATYWANQISSWGNKYQVIRVYTPNNEPYTNSLIINNRVFVPQTGSVYDAAALDRYNEAMPGYEIIGVSNYNSGGGWLSTDALHCRTHEVPDKHTIEIVHYPLLDQQEESGFYVITADVIDLSQTGIKLETLKVTYRLNGGEWQEKQLLQTGIHQFSALLLNPGEGSIIEYYLSGENNLGRKVCHPYIGESDPHRFSCGSQLANEECLVLSAEEIRFTQDSSFSQNVQYTNIGEEEIVISALNREEMNYSEVMPLDENFALPYVLEPGSSLSFQISPLIVTKQSVLELNIDTLILSSNKREYQLLIKCDKSFLSGLDNYESVELHAYPNPFTDRFVIEVESEEGLKAYLYDIKGRRIAEIKPKLMGNKTIVNYNQFDYQELDPGVYVVQIHSDKFVHSIRMIKR